MTIKTIPGMFKINDKVIIITGVGLIGSVVLKAIAEAGAKVIFCDINKSKGKEIESEYKKEGLNVSFKELDITSEDSVNEVIDFCISKFERIDSWINIAYPRSQDWGNHNILEYKSWKENVNKHLGGYYITSIKAAEIMKVQGYGCLLNFSSIYGITAPDFKIYEGTDMTNPIAYTAIKGGINMFTKYIAAYYGKYNVRANVIAPGGVFDNQPEPFYTNYKKRVPLNRMARPEDMVGPVIFLVSDASTYITGQVIAVDGGWTIW